MSWTSLVKKLPAAEPGVYVAGGTLLVLMIVLIIAIAL